MTPVTDFQTEVLASNLPVLVDFYADWCAPCRALSPRLQQLSLDNAGKLNVVKVNVEDHPDLAGEYSVRALPTLMTFKNGQVVDTHVGLASPDKLADLVSKL